MGAICACPPEGLEDTPSRVRNLQPSQKPRHHHQIHQHRKASSSSGSSPVGSNRSVVFEDQDPFLQTQLKVRYSMKATEIWKNLQFCFDITKKNKRFDMEIHKCYRAILSVMKQAKIREWYCKKPAKSVNPIDLDGYWLFEICHYNRKPVYPKISILSFRWWFYCKHHLHCASPRNF